MQILHERNKVPPGGWRYTDQDQLFKGPNLDHLISSVREFYFTNGKVPPKNLEMLIMDQICKSIPDPENKCVDATPPTKAELLVRATRALGNFLRSGFKTVTNEQLLSRREVCESCSFWKGEAAFGIGRCGSCGCYGLKLYAASENCPQGKWNE